MSISIPSQGTHFSDGVRTGPILGTQYTPGANVLSPSQIISSPNDTTPPGIYNTPLALHDIIPYPVNASALAASQALGAAGYFTLITASGPGVTVKSSFGGQTGPGGAAVIQLDSPRNVTITSAGNDSGVNFTVFGWDFYGEPMVEQITGANTTVATGNKAFYIIRGVYGSAATAANATVGVGNTFGLPYFCPAANYFGVPEWNNAPDTLSAPVLLANNPLTSTMGSATIVVTVPSTAGLISGSLVQIKGAVGFDTITAAELNIVAPITILSGTTFNYVSDGSGGVGASGGGAAVTYTVVSPGVAVAGTIVVADQRTATATTGDVRGTYTPSTNADGIKRLTIDFYAPSADARKYNGASNSATINLITSPLSNINLSSVITVTAPGHQLTTGELVTISGATTFAGISVGNINLTNTAAIVVDQNTFTYVAGAAGTGGTGGGSNVLLSPSKGNLYQIPVGKFGVSQYSVSLF